MAASDLLTFDSLSWQLTETEAALERLRSESDDHESETGHNPIGEPATVESVTLGPGVPLETRGQEEAMAAPLSSIHESQPLAIGPDTAFCEVKHRLLDQMLQAIRELSQLQASQLKSVIEGSSEFTGIEAALHEAQQKKEDAKYALIAHISSHRCENA